VIELRGMIDRKELVEHIPGSKNAGEGIIPPLTGMGVGVIVMRMPLDLFTPLELTFLFSWLLPFSGKRKKAQKHWRSTLQFSLDISFADNHKYYTGIFKIWIR